MPLGVHMVAKIAVIFYSTYGHVRTLAEALAEEARATGVEVDLLQFPEILSEEIRGKMHAAPRAEYPEVTPADLEKYDGFLIGSPTRYGRVAAAVSSFFDATGGLWAQGKLVGKMCGLFTSSASQHGGQESTALTTIPFLAHHGIIYVPIGFAASELTDNSEVVAGSAYGAAAIAGGDGSRAVSEKELKIAKFQAQSFSKIVKQYVAGRDKLAAHAVAPVDAAAVTKEDGAPVLGKALPTEAAPYEVADSSSSAAAAAEPTKAATPAATEQTPTPASAPAAVEEKPVVAATPAPAKKEEPKKKKGGIFAMCCGGGSQNYDN
ncbi:hypothetical protein JCM11251_002465 [Rhodosporidiobolus azoricus]